MKEVEEASLSPEITLVVSDDNQPQEELGITELIGQDVDISNEAQLNETILE